MHTNATLWSKKGRFVLPGISLSECHEGKKLRIHNINDKKLHGSIEKLSEKGKNKGKNRVWMHFGICTLSRLEAS